MSEEVVILLSGAMTLIHESSNGLVRATLDTPGQAFVIPRGAWHTADVPQQASAIFLTHGRGAENRPR